VNSKYGDLSLGARLAQFVRVVGNCNIRAADGAEHGLDDGIKAIVGMLASVRDRRGSVYVVGNGGSAGIAGHAVTDFVNVAKLRAFTLHDSSLLTCMANDFGYENAFARLLGQMASPGDALIAISSSGRSLNILNAAIRVKESGGTVITLSGFTSDNPLRALGDVNVWLDSNDYGMVEIGHQFVLHNIADRFGAGFGN
jgi:D-sedoheptulose 7-phosphate isomerase